MEFALVMIVIVLLGGVIAKLIVGTPGVKGISGDTTNTPDPFNDTDVPHHEEISGPEELHPN